MAWPCHALLGGPACSTKFSKIFWTTAYSMQEESWKNIKPFSYNNFLNNKWVWPCHALLSSPACSTKFSKIFWTTAYSTRCKRNHGKIFILFLVIIFLIKNGCCPATPISVSRHARQNLQKNVVPQHSLLDVKGIMEKYSSVFLL